MRPTKVNKAIVSGLAMLLDAAVVAMADDIIDMSEKQHFITSLITIAVGVYAVWRTPNPVKDDAK